jgi:hypothetical protein
VKGAPHGQAELAAVLGQLEEGAPRLYSRWSGKAWRLACRGPASALWDALADSADGHAAFADYLFLLREAIGLQYLAATTPEDLLPGAASHGFLAVMLCETLPRLLPSLAAAGRAQSLASIWNVGEKLVGKPVWLDRYLAARLPELEALSGFEKFLERVLGEGLDDLPPATWTGSFTIGVVDPSRHDAAFLPGEMHLATPAIACIHDRRRDGRHVAVLLRRGSAKPLCLGVTPCLGREGSGSALAGLDGVVARAVTRAGADLAGPPSAALVAPGGFVVLASERSQRLWVAESAA